MQIPVLFLQGVKADRELRDQLTCVRVVHQIVVCWLMRCLTSKAQRVWVHDARLPRRGGYQPEPTQLAPTCYSVVVSSALGRQTLQIAIPYSWWARANTSRHCCGGRCVVRSSCPSLRRTLPAPAHGCGRRKAVAVKMLVLPLLYCLPA